MKLTSLELEKGGIILGHNCRKRRHRDLRKAAEEIGASLMSCSGWDKVSSHARVRLDERLPEGKTIPSRREIKALAGEKNGRGKRILKFGEAKIIIGGKRMKMVTYIA